MKLRNKKTGKIERACPIYVQNCGEFNSLAELNEVLEDYEEPKNINEIDVVLDAVGEYCNEHSHYSGDLEKIKILNIVEEKLKAWKRLKDKGAEFKGWGWEAGLGNYVVLGTKDADHLPDEIEFNRRKDLDLLFGGKE